MLRGEFAVLQAAMLDGLSLDPLALFDDGCGPSEVGVGRGDVVEALVVAAMVVVLDEGLDLAFEIAGQEVVFEQDAVLEGLVPAFDLALGLRMERCATNMAHLLHFDIFGQPLAGRTRNIIRLSTTLLRVCRPKSIAP